MTKLKETLEKHRCELRNDECTACFPKQERTAKAREEMTKFLKWTVLNGDHDGNSEQSRTHERHNLDCRRLAPTWKLFTIVLYGALSFDWLLRCAS